MARATGLIAGPDNPPVIFPRNGRRLSTSTAIPTSVLIREMPSAPAPATARAIPAMSVTLGVSLAITGRRVFRRTARTTWAEACGSQPKDIPPRSRFGQEMLSSYAAIPSTSSRRTTISPNSSAVSPAMLTTTRVSNWARNGHLSPMNASRPGFCKPIEFSIPAAVSTTRGGRLPALGSGVIVLLTSPPRRDSSVNSINSWP